MPYCAQAIKHYEKKPYCKQCAKEFDSGSHSEVILKNKKQLTKIQPNNTRSLTKVIINPF